MENKDRKVPVVVKLVAFKSLPIPSRLPPPPPPLQVACGPLFNAVNLLVVLCPLDVVGPLHVGPLECVGAEEVALGLRKVSRRVLGPVAVKVVEAGAKGWAGNP